MVTELKNSRWSVKRMAAGLTGLTAASAIAFFIFIEFQGGSPSIVPGKAHVRLLGPTQYRNIINDVFGPTIELGGRFGPGMRIDGLLALGASKASVTPADMEQYANIAQTVAEQVVSERNRALLIPCKPDSAGRPDDSCASEFFAKVGKLLYRRPLNASQLDLYVGAAHEATEQVQDFYTGLSLSLAAMLSSPQFLFLDAELEPDPEHEGGYRLDAFSRATRLSFLLWNSSPDTLLLEAAEKGELDTERGLERQVERMMASPRLEDGVRAFFSDFFEFSEIANLRKDAKLFPKFSAEVAATAEEETLRTVVDIVLTREADYRKIFTTKKTFLAPELGAIYQVAVVNEGPNGSPDRWVPFEYPADDPRGGILTQVAFTALHSPAGRSSPTLRGQAAREVVLCQKVPAPPADVPFAIVQDTNNPIHKTARERLKVHATEPACSGCHKIMDPIGLALENFDGAGGYRTAENGVDIDASGTLDGVHFEDAAGLGSAVASNPAATSCVVNRLFAYALGRPATDGERPWTRSLLESFTDSGYRVTHLLKEIATGEATYRAAMPDTFPPNQTIARNEVQQ